jgi:ketosteroid isomerase-like protein
VKSVAVADIVWTFAGKSRISGEARGVEGIMKRARVIASYNVKFEIIRSVLGFDGVAMLLHNTGMANGRVLDEQLAAVFTFRGEKIARLDTYLSDVAMMENFFDAKQ